MLAFNPGSAFRQSTSNTVYLTEPINTPVKAAKAFSDQQRYWQTSRDIYNNDYSHLH